MELLNKMSSTYWRIHLQAAYYLCIIMVYQVLLWLFVDLDPAATTYFPLVKDRVKVQSPGNVLFPQGTWNRISTTHWLVYHGGQCKPRLPDMIAHKIFQHYHGICVRNEATGEKLIQSSPMEFHNILSMFKTSIQSVSPVPLWLQSGKEYRCQTR